MHALLTRPLMHDTMSERSLSNCPRMGREDRMPEKDRKRRRPSSDTREKIQAAAMRLFAERGFHATTTRMIAQEAGVAEGTIYVHFANKKKILFAALQPLVVTTLPEEMGQTDEVSGEADDLEVVAAFLRSRFRIFEQYGDLMKALLAQAIFDRELAEHFASEVLEDVISLVSSYVDRRMSEGAFRTFDTSTVTRALAGHFLSAVFIFGILRMRQPEGFNYDTYCRDLADLFLNGVRRRDP